MEFKINSLITTNNRNIFKVLGVNEHDIAVQDTLNGDFNVLSKTEHEYKEANIKEILKQSVVDCVNDYQGDKEIHKLINNMIDKWL
jgi:hypothetical protein